MSSKCRRYYQYTEKETHTISVKWKAFHSILFFLITINSLWSVFAFYSISTMFNHHCILYAKPTFYLKDIVYLEPEPETEQIDPNAPNNVPTNNNVTSNVASNVTSNVMSNVMSNVTSSTVPMTSSAAPDDKTKDDEYLFRNNTVEGVVGMDTRKTAYASLATCDFVLFNTMVSMILAAFFGALVIICGKGGRGFRLDILPQPWLYVYPILITSCVMVIVSIITGNTVIHGLQDFCLGFLQLTEKKERLICTRLINYFAYEDGLHGYVKHNFYNMYIICLYSFNIGIILWIAQFIVTLLRVIFVVDFQLNSVTVKCKKRENEEAVREVLVKSFPELTEDKRFNNKNEEIQLEEGTTKL